jgi:N-acetylglucosamine-6-phosphate deacetylase
VAQQQTTRILAGRIVDAQGERENVAVTIADRRIVALENITNALRPRSGDIDARDALLLPGFIDIHVHGGAGRYVMEGTQDAMQAIARHLARHGVTGFLATTVTGPWEQQAQALAVTAQTMRSEGSASEENAAKDSGNGVENVKSGAAILGCHLEGPYINPKKKGAQPAQYVRLPDVKELQRECGDNLKYVRVVTLAPEMPGGLELTRFLAGQGIIASIGHTDATYEQMGAAIDAGARHVTHCYNAMRPLDSREPGVVGAALARPELSAELIWDNVHVHPASCRALINAKTAQGVILISDGIQGADMGDGYEFSLGDLTIVVRDGTARLSDGTLAGSVLTLDRAFANAAPFSLAERARMTSYNAAVALGLGHRKGLLRPGYDADLTLLNADGAVRQTWVAGAAAL